MLRALGAWTGSFIPKCNPMNPLRPYIPCESVCQDYAAKCGKPRELVCAVFGDPEDPDPRPASTPIKMCKGVWQLYWLVARHFCLPCLLSQSHVWSTFGRVLGPHRLGIDMPAWQLSCGPTTDDALLRACVCPLSLRLVIVPTVRPSRVVSPHAWCRPTRRASR